MKYLLSDYHYGDEQDQVKQQVDREIRNHYEWIKLYLITIMDAHVGRRTRRALLSEFDCRGVTPMPAGRLMRHTQPQLDWPEDSQKIDYLTGDYINNPKSPRFLLHAEEDLERVNLSNIAAEAYKGIDYCFRLLFGAESLEDKIKAVTLTLNVWHMSGSLFCEEEILPDIARTYDGIPTPAAPFTRKELDDLSNIPTSRAEYKLKKLFKV